MQCQAKKFHRTKPDKPQIHINKISTVDLLFFPTTTGKLQKTKWVIEYFFIDQTKSFDLVSIDGFFKIINNVGCPLKSQSHIESMYNSIICTLQYDENLFYSFKTPNGVKQGCLHTLFEIFFSLTLKHVFCTMFIHLIKY